MSRFLINEEEFKYIKQLRKEIIKCSKRLGYSIYTGKLTYMIQDPEVALSFYDNKNAYQNSPEVIFRFWGDEDDFQTNGMQYKTTETIFWHLTSVEEFHSMIFDYPSLEYEVYSITSKQCPKITKPKELRGIKPIGSIPYIRNRSKCQVFIKDDDVWVKHTDYFSPSIRIKGLEGAPISAKLEALGAEPKSKKFIYEDNWGDIVQKIQAWIRVKNLNHPLQLKSNEVNLSNQVIQLISGVERIPYRDLLNTEISRFWEEVVKEVRKHSSKTE